MFLKLKNTIFNSKEIIKIETQFILNTEFESNKAPYVMTIYHNAGNRTELFYDNKSNFEQDYLSIMDNLKVRL